MNHLAEVPLWAAIPIALLTVVGSSLALIGSYGLARLRTFYERLHPPTLGATGNRRRGPRVDGALQRSGFAAGRP